MFQNSLKMFVLQVRDEVSSFDQGSLLCEFDLSAIQKNDSCITEISSTKTHLCGKDKYDGRIGFKNGKLCSVIFDVTGPEKSSRISTQLTASL